MAQGFLISRLFCPVISPGGRSLILMNWPMLRAGHLGRRLAASFRGFWHAQMLKQGAKEEHAFTAPQFIFFWTTGRNGVLSDNRTPDFTWAWAILTFLSCNCRKSLFVRATVNFLWILLPYLQNKYFPSPLRFPLHLCLKQVIGAGLQSVILPKG